MLSKALGVCVCALETGDSMLAQASSAKSINSGQSLAHSGTWQPVTLAFPAPIYLGQPITFNMQTTLILHACWMDALDTAHMEAYTRRERANE